MDKNRATKGDGTVWQMKDGRWRAQIIINGKLIMKESRTEKGAKDKLNEIKKAHSSGKSNFKKITYSELLARWLNFKKSDNIKSQSYERVENTINTHIEPKIGFYNVEYITAEIIEKEVMSKVKNTRTKKELSYSSLKKIYDALNESFDFAVAEKIITNSPMYKVREPKKEAVKSSQKVEILKPEEVERFIQACNRKYKSGKYIHSMACLFVFMLNTGTRLGEAQALTYADYDENSKTVNIDKSIVYQKDKDGVKHAVEQQSTKTKGSNRVLPLNKHAVQAIAQAKSVQGYDGKRPSNYIFSTTGNTPISLKTIYTMVNNIYAEANIEAKGTHILRHTYASRLFEKDADVKIISELLGHSSIKTTLDIYVHVINVENAKVREIMEDIY